MGTNGGWGRGSSGRGRSARQPGGGGPEQAARRDRAATAPGLSLPTEAQALARLREVANAGQDFILLFAPENEPYDQLIKG